MEDPSTWISFCRHALDTVSLTMSPVDLKSALLEALNVDISTPPGSVADALLRRVYIFAVGQEFTPLQMTALISIVYRVHKESVEGVLGMEASFALLSDLLCRHAIHRPPFSVGIWTLIQLRRISEWIVEEYYEKYRLYQGICRPRLTLDLSTRQPSDIVEYLPDISPLAEAITEEEYQRRREEESQAETKKQERERVIEAEATMQRSLSQLPPETRAAVETYMNEKIKTAAADSKPNPDQDEQTLTVDPMSS